MTEVVPTAPIFGDCYPIDEGEASCTREVRYSHSGIDEYWRVVQSGFKHGWDIETPPRGAGPIVLRLALSGLARSDVDEAGVNATFYGVWGTWRYVDLMVSDALGAPVPASMLMSQEGLLISIDDSAAVYPLAVDPVLIDTKIVASDPGQDDGQYGWSVSGAGDVNDDGFSDVLVGAKEYDLSGDDEGVAYVYLGSDGGIVPAFAGRLSASDHATWDQFGDGTSGAGDTNGDGFDDVVVGAFGDDFLGDRAGSAYIFLGSAQGVDLATEIKLVASDREELDSFGDAVSGAGDLDSDGYDDIVVAAQWDDDNGSNAGAIYIFYGGAFGVDPASETKLVALDGSSNAWYGYSVAGAGDVDGDGYDDLIVGAALWAEDEAGAAYLYFGGPSGVHALTEVKITASDGFADNYFGAAVDGAGDVNGDGYDDVIVGANRDDWNGFITGAAYIYLGGPGGIDLTSETKLMAFDGEADDSYGTSVAGTGDINLDGYADVIVGAPGDDNDNGADAGAAYVYLGGPTGIEAAAVTKLLNPAGEADDQFGISVAGAGDVDGSGTMDIIVGAYQDRNNTPDRGSATIFLGCTVIWHLDADGDGFGDPSTPLGHCDQPTGYVENADDCDDTQPQVGPGNPEICDGLDNDCDGLVDNDATDASTWYADLDGDGFPNAGNQFDSCDEVDGYLLAPAAFDCDDGDPSVHPDAREIPDDGVDQDCNGRDRRSSGGCGCTTAPPSVLWLWLLPLGMVALRTRARKGSNGPRPSPGGTHDTWQT